MDHWVTSEEIKVASRKRRRLDAKEMIQHEENEEVMVGPEDIHNGSHREILGSDVVNDGMYIELQDASEQVIACVFRSDATGEFEISVGTADAHSEEISSFIQRAKDRLNARYSV